MEEVYRGPYNREVISYMIDWSKRGSEVRRQAIESGVRYYPPSSDRLVEELLTNIVKFLKSDRISGTRVNVETLANFIKTQRDNFAKSFTYYSLERVLVLVKRLQYYPGKDNDVYDLEYLLGVILRAL